MKQDSLCFAERNLVLRLSPTDGIFLMFAATAPC